MAGQELAWQFTQYCAKPILAGGFDGAGGQSGSQPLAGPNPYQPQNQPSREASRSRTMIAAPLVGNSRSGSTPAQTLAEAGYISGLYQITTGEWVPR